MSLIDWSSLPSLTPNVGPDFGMVERDAGVTYHDKGRLVGTWRPWFNIDSER